MSDSKNNLICAMCGKNYVRNAKGCPICSSTIARTTNFSHTTSQNSNVKTPVGITNRHGVTSGNSLARLMSDLTCARCGRTRSKNIEKCPTCGSSVTRR